MAITHNTLTNDAANADLKLLHLPGYSVATVSAMTSISTAAAGDICYVEAFRVSLRTPTLTCAITRW